MRSLGHYENSGICSNSSRTIQHYHTSSNIEFPKIKWRTSSAILRTAAFLGCEILTSQASRWFAHQPGFHTSASSWKGRNQRVPAMVMDVDNWVWSHLWCHGFIMAHDANDVYSLRRDPSCWEHSIPQIHPDSLTGEIEIVGDRGGGLPESPTITSMFFSIKSSLYLVMRLWLYNMPSFNMPLIISPYS